MKAPVLEVWNDDRGGCRLAGRLYVNPSRGKSGVHAAFEYDREWLASATAFPIDPASLPLRAGPIHRDDLFPALEDTGPDRWGRLLIGKRTAETGGSLTAVDYLLGLSDLTRIGSLRYRWEGTSEYLARQERHIPPLVSLRRLLHASDAVQLGMEKEEDLNLLLASGSPPGGARPKATVIDADGSMAIAKFPRGGRDDVRSIARGEILALTLASRAGIRVARARLVSVGRRDLSVIARFDRAGDRRIPFISARTLLGAPKDEDGSYVEIADAIRRHGSAPESDLAELWRRLVFGRLVNNCDDHLRNHGFLRINAGGWRLSPAYDINPVPEQESRQLMATPVAPGRDGGVAVAMEVIASFGLTLRQAREQLHRLLEALQGWKTAGILDRKAVVAYSTAFENGENKEALKLLSPRVNLSGMGAGVGGLHRGDAPTARAPGFTSRPK